MGGRSEQVVNKSRAALTFPRSQSHIPRLHSSLSSSSAWGRWRCTRLFASRAVALLSSLNMFCLASGVLRFQNSFVSG